MTCEAVHVSNQVVGFARKLVATGEMQILPLALPPQRLETRGVWWAMPQPVIDRAAISPADLPGAAHAASTPRSVSPPLVATCDRWDVEGVSTPYRDSSAAIFVYDGYAGGAGIMEAGYRTSTGGCARRSETVRECPCARLPLVRAVAEVRRRERAARQGAGAVALLSAMLGVPWG